MAKQHLLIQTAYLGDLLLSIPLLKRIRLIYPHDSIHLICKKNLGSLFIYLKLADKIWEIDKQKGKQQSISYILESLKKIHFENIFCPHESLTSAILVYNLSATKKISFNKWWNKLIFNQRINKIKTLPEPLRQISLLNNLDNEIKDYLTKYYKNQQNILNGININNISGNNNNNNNNNNQSNNNFWKLDESNKNKSINKVDSIVSMSMKNYFEKNKNQEYHKKNIFKTKYICFAPGSVWPTKRWPINKFIELGNMLNKDGYSIILLGAKEENQICNSIVEKINDCHNYCTKTDIIESAWFIFFSKALITNDCGAMHLASMLEIPTLAIFGPTILNFGYRPWQNQAIVVQNMNLKCRPCGKHGPKKCPIGTHECMESISSNKVYKKLLKFLSR